MNQEASHRVGRIIHDADSHIIEYPGWLESYASEYVRNNLEPGLVPLDLPALKPLLETSDERLAGKQPEKTEELKENLFGHPEKRNMWTAFGSRDKKERSESLDIAGLSKQLVFPSIAASRFSKSSDLRLVYGGSEALNRAMSDFCSDDPRLLAVGTLQMHDPDKALESLKQGIEFGIKTFWIKSDAIDGRAPSHFVYDPIWATMQEAGIPVTLHIGSGVNMPDEYRNVGVDSNAEVASVTNIETTAPIDLPVLHHSAERWLTCMIYHGVLERFPDLKIGLIELGANWVPTSMQNLDIGVSALGKFDEGLKKLSLKPSDYVRRQVRVTPFHMENTGWTLRNVGKDILMFNTDYPHPEGGGDPFGAFERSLNAVDATEEELDHFYRLNFEDYMGAAAS